jgi:hypothetical protein
MKQGSSFIRNRDWEKYSKIVSNFLDQDAGRQTIIWAKHVNQPLSHGEDSVPNYHYIEIEALCYYNAFRNWPINKATSTGELDEENLSILVSRKYIEDHGYLDANDYWDFNWVEDRFLINGIPYRPTGDTQVAQAKDTALVFLIILKRDRDSRIEDEDWVDGLYTS